MKKHIATYHTRTGKVALRIENHTDHKGKVTYNYDGKHGAGSGHPLHHVQQTLRLILQSHRGIRLAAGHDILVSPCHNLDPDHPSLAITGNESFPTQWSGCTPDQLTWLSLHGSYMQRIIANRHLAALKAYPV